MHRPNTWWRRGGTAPPVRGRPDPGVYERIPCFDFALLDSHGQDSSGAIPCLFPVPATGLGETGIPLRDASTRPRARLRETLAAP